MKKKKSTYNTRRSQRPRTIGTRAKAILLACLIGLVCCSTLYCCGKSSREERNTHYETSRQPIEDLMKVTVPDSIPEIMVPLNGFTVSFNPEKHLANYVVWELTEEKANGTVPRRSDFHPEPNLEGCPTLADYRRSGYDRGHMAPAGDMKWDSLAMYDSHSLANICPQDHSVNGGRWNSLEMKCREWAAADSVIIIICGPVLTDRMPIEIGETPVPVPERFFKIVLAPYANPPRAIAFLVPNSPAPDGLEDLVVTVDQIEEITGLDFFSALPDDIEAQIEQTSNYRQWKKHR